jgi:hypothetical protein
MRVLLALLLLAMSFVTIGCARRDQATYVDLPPEPLSAEPELQISSLSPPSPANSDARRSVDDSPRKAPEEKPAAKEQPAAQVVKEKHEESRMSFAAIQAKAQLLGVERLSKSDVEGLSFAQIQELRGY